MADRVVIDTGQFDRFEVMSPNPVRQIWIGYDRRSCCGSISYHAPEPEKRRNPHRTPHRCHETVSRQPMHAVEQRNDLRQRALVPRLLQRFRNSPSPTRKRGVSFHERTLQLGATCRRNQNISQRLAARSAARAAIGLLRHNPIGVCDALDPLLDISQHIEAGFKCLGRYVPQHIGRNDVP
jgi:hypothetical protein